MKTGCSQALDTPMGSSAQCSVLSAKLGLSPPKSAAPLSTERSALRTSVSNTQRPAILHIPRRFVADDWGGTETVVLEYTRQQRRAGFDARIVTSKALCSTSNEVIGEVPVQRHRYCYPFFGLSAADCLAMDKKGGNLLSISLFTALLTAPNVRLFHAHTLKRLGGEVRTAARLRGKPFVVSVHGGVFDVPQNELDSLLKPIESKFEWGRPFGALFGSRRVLEDADLVICVGKEEAEQSKAKLGHDRVAYLPNGVDAQRFATGDGTAFRAQHGIPANAFVVLQISRIDPQKNQALLVEAFAQLAKTDPVAHLVLIGHVTSANYHVQITRRIEELGLRDRVHLIAGISHDSPDLVNALHACDVFVLPSLHEPFGIVVLEAWSAGKPVIASHVGGLRGFVKAEENGLFIDPAQALAADELNAKLELLRVHPDLRETLGANGRHEARTHYDWSAVNEQLEQLYQRAEASHAARKKGGSAS